MKTIESWAFVSVPCHFHKLKVR